MDFIYSLLNWVGWAPENRPTIPTWATDHFLGTRRIGMPSAAVDFTRNERAPTYSAAFDHGPLWKPW